MVLPAHVLTSVGGSSRGAGQTVFLAPVELLALAWSVPLAILVIMVPVGLAVSGVLWLGRLIVGRF